MATSSGRIKVMILAPTLGKGGAERVLSLLMEHLDRRRFLSELALFKPETDYPVPADVPVHVLGEMPASNRVCSIKVPEELAQLHVADLEWMRATVAKLVDLVYARTPDVIVSSPVWAAMMASIAAECMPPSVRLLSRIDAPPSVAIAAGRERDLFAHLIREYFGHTSRFVAVARGVSDDLVGNFGVNPSRVLVIHNPANMRLIENLAPEPVDDGVFSEGLPVVLFVGRLERVKGLEHLLRAFALLDRASSPNLVLIGKGSQQRYLASLARHLGIERSVHFIGSRENPYKYMARATLLVLPSLSEGMSNVLVEAMACGCPIVATDIEGGVTREILMDGECGLIIPRGDEPALATAMAALLNDSGMRERYAAAGFQRAFDFDLPVVMAEYEQAIVDAAESDLERPRALCGEKWAGGNQPELRTLAAIPSAPGRVGMRSLAHSIRSALGMGRSWFQDLSRTAVHATNRSSNVESHGGSSARRSQSCVFSSYNPRVRLGPPKLLCVEQSEGESGLELLFGAVTLALAKAKFDVVVVSANSDTDRLRSLASDSGVSDGTVEFVPGPKYGDDLLAACSALVHSSSALSVGTPKDIIRARDAGLRIIWANASQVTRESVGGDESDVPIKAGNVEGFSEAILQVVWDEEYKDKSDQFGREPGGNT